MGTMLLLYWILCSQILLSEQIFLIQGVVMGKNNAVQTDFSSKYQDKPQSAPKYELLPQENLAQDNKSIRPTTHRPTLAERVKASETSMIARMRKSRIEEVQRRNANRPQYETRIMARQRELLNQRRSQQRNVGAANKHTNGLSLKRQYLDNLRWGNFLV